MTVDPATPTAEQIAEWVALADKATPGPWHVYVSAATLNLLTDDNRVVCYVDDFGAELKKHDSDAAFIVAARTAVPALAAALSSERAVSAGLRAEVERLNAGWTRAAKAALTAERDALQAQVQADRVRVLRAIVADVERTYPLLRDPDRHSEWGQGVVWLLDRMTNIAADVESGDDESLPIAALAAAQPTKETQ